jgi:hypothetical protein
MEKTGTSTLLHGDPYSSATGHGLVGISHQIDEDAREVFEGESHCSRARQAFHFKLHTWASDGRQQIAHFTHAGCDIFYTNLSDRIGTRREIMTRIGRRVCYQLLDQAGIGDGKRMQLRREVLMIRRENAWLCQQFAVNLQSSQNITCIMRESCRC